MRKKKKKITCPELRDSSTLLSCDPAPKSTGGSSLRFGKLICPTHCWVLQSKTFHTLPCVTSQEKCRSHPLVTRCYPSHVPGHVYLNLKYSREDILLPVLKDPAARSLQVMNYFGSAMKATKAHTKPNQPSPHQN